MYQHVGDDQWSDKCGKRPKKKILLTPHTSLLRCRCRGMKQHNSPFTSPPTLPSIIAKYVEESSLKSMEPGEITSATPWSIRWCELHGLHTSLGTRERFCEPGGTCTALIIKDEENFVIDLTNIRKSDMMSLGGTHSCSCDSSDQILFSGVLWPLAEAINGTYDPAIELFNLEQLELRENFYRYYEAAFGRPYEYAHYSVPDHWDD
jgi:hypothetical protein